MALEALRDVFLQAGQDYAKRVRQDELLAQERARQDELYARQRGDTEKDMNRRRDEQIASEGRAEARVKDAEQREITNAVKRVNALGAAEASNVMRRAVYMSGKPGALDPDVMSDAEVMKLYPAALKNKQIQDSVNSMSAEIEAKKQTLKDYKDLTKEQQADQLQTQSRYYETLNERISNVNSRIEELGKSGGVNAERATATYNSVLESFVNRATGGNKAQFIADKFPNNKKNPPSEMEILLASGYYQAFESEVKNRMALEKANDPEVTKLLAEYQNLMVSRRDTEQKLTALNFDFSKAASADKPATAAAPAGTPKIPGTPTPAALKAAVDAAKGRAPTPANPGSPSVGVDSNDREAEGGDGTGNFFVNGAAVAPSTPASAAAPTSVAAPAKATPAWWSTERDNDKNRQDVLNFFASVPGRVAGAAGSVFDAAQTGASYLNPNNYVSGRTAPAYSKTPPPPQGMNATVVYDPEAAAKNRRFNDERLSTPAEFFTTGNATSKINTALPDVATSGGPLSTSAFFSSAQDPTLAYQLPMDGSPKPKNFGESFAQRYNDVKNSNMSPNDKAKSLEALVQTRDLLVSRGLTYDSPDPASEFNTKTSNVGGTVYTGPMSRAPGWAQGGATVSPQTFPAYFTPKR